MGTFYQTLGFVTAICAGIIIIALFFTGLGYFNRAARGSGVVKLNGFIQEGKLVNVLLTDGRSVKDVRFLGFADFRGKQGVPYPLSSMIVFETLKGSQVMVRSDAVRMIEEVEENV